MLRASSCVRRKSRGRTAFAVGHTVCLRKNWFGRPGVGLLIRKREQHPGHLLGERSMRFVARFAAISITLIGITANTAHGWHGQYTVVRTTVHSRGGAAPIATYGSPVY